MIGKRTFETALKTTECWS